MLLLYYELACAQNASPPLAGYFVGGLLTGQRFPADRFVRFREELAQPHTMGLAQWHAPRTERSTERPALPHESRYLL